MILHPDVGEGAKPAGSSLQAGFFMPAGCRVKRQSARDPLQMKAAPHAVAAACAHRGEQACMAWRCAQKNQRAIMLLDVHGVRATVRMRDPCHPGQRPRPPDGFR
ncbi:hypothetical protein [Xanthomonas citri]|uniref:hypothetical protein n=1 Tax=Xanthomonas citri TaxID=346 RepID=UPI0012FE5945|nr:MULTISPECIES: hypothetical protein [Xanthomonas]MEE5090087.1 hypothetical protein [Xanthomonas euvesicatoria]MCT8355571.1 hypothetical protein [Xanthomonas citri pv. anacardii]MCT8359446.1 hypothetical protein [Xanthomonas citri pv. anacardii]MCT8365755.1 hypothetical protein [Xanthomonas citri pv. anacardii]MCT8367523.1 hypothetical protein [Xanthomonas citri pv. anacardii]